MCGDEHAQVVAAGRDLAAARLAIEPRGGRQIDPGVDAEVITDGKLVTVGWRLVLGTASWSEIGGR
jgi:hypothetical protein